MERRRSSVFARAPPRSPEKTAASAFSPNNIRAQANRLTRADRTLFDHVATKAFSTAPLAALAAAKFRIDPMPEAFLGAWMSQDAECRTKTLEQLVGHQKLVQLLTETRFDALQRLVSFFVCVCCPHASLISLVALLAMHANRQHLRHCCAVSSTAWERQYRISGPLSRVGCSVTT